MKISRKELKLIVEQFLGPLNPLVLLGLATANKAEELNLGGDLGDLSLSGLSSAIGQMTGGVLNNFMLIKTDGTLNSKHFTSNTFDKYYHSLGFCIVTMTHVIESIKSVTGSVSEEEKQKIINSVKQNLKDAGVWKESFYDHALGLGQAGADDLKANKFGIDQAFNENWRENIYQKFAPTMKESGYKGYIGNENAHYHYLLDPSLRSIKERLNIKESGNFKFVPPPFNCLLNVSDLEIIINLEKEYAGVGKMEHNIDLCNTFKSYMERDYIRELQSLLS